MVSFYEKKPLAALRLARASGSSCSVPRDAARRAAL